MLKTARHSWTSFKDFKVILNLSTYIGNLWSLTHVGSTLDSTAGYKTWFVARLICNIRGCYSLDVIATKPNKLSHYLSTVNSRWLHCYGMREARTDRLASFHEPRVERKLDMLGHIVSGMLFFCAPNTYVDRLEKVWADNIVSIYDWQSLLTSLLSEWSDSNLLVSKYLMNIFSNDRLICYLYRLRSLCREFVHFTGIKTF